MKKLLLTVIVILVAGCVADTDTGSQSDQGIIIDSLRLSPTEVTDKEPFDLFFEVRNVGGKKTKVFAYIYGPSWISEDETDLGEQELIAPDKQSGSIGESFVFEKTYDQPIEVRKGIVEEEIVYGRICYPYTSSASTDVEIISLSEKRQTEVKQAAKTVRTSNSDAPIRIELTIKEPLVDYGDDQVVPIAVRVINVGGGFATAHDGDCTMNPEISEMDKVTVTLEGSGITCNGTNEVHLSNNKATLFCKLEATTNGLPSKNVKIIAEAKYNYYKTKTATIKIIGTQA